MTQNDENSLNEEITELIIKLNNIDPDREEQSRNCLLTVSDRVIRDYVRRQRVDSGNKCGTSSGY